MTIHTTLDKDVPVDHRRYGNDKFLDTDWVQNVLIPTKNNVENLEKKWSKMELLGQNSGKG